MLSPVLVSFAVTRQCQLSCPHCYSNSGQRDAQELNTAEAKRVIGEIADLGTKLLIFDGGEPTLREDLLELIEHARAKGLRPVLGSNGISITRQVAQQLKQAGLKEVQLSLDGARPETHDEFRGEKGAWQKTLEAAKNLNQAGVGFQLAPLLHSGNYKELEGIVKLSHQLGANAVEIFDYVPAGRGKEHPEYELNTQQRMEVIDKIIELQRKDDKLIYRVVGLPQYWAMVEKKIPEEEILLKFVRTCCAAGTRYITIMPNGDVYPCMVLQVKLGNIRQQSLKEIWGNSPILKRLRNRDNLKGKCNRCKYRDSCGGARCKAYEKTGDFLAEDPTCWF